MKIQILVFIYKVLLEHGLINLLTYILWLIPTARTDLCNNNRNRMACNA